MHSKQKKQGVFYENKQTGKDDRDTEYTVIYSTGGGVSCKTDTPDPQVNQFTVTFDADGGSAVDAAKIDEGKTVPKPTDPTKNGYTFKGWFEGEAETEFDFENTQITADKTLKAKWDVVTYTITYELNGGTKADEASYPLTYTIESAEITLPKPNGPSDKPNFAGWYLESDFKNKVSVITAGSTGDKTFYAKWSAEAIIEYTVTFVLKGAEGSTSIMVNKGEKISQSQLDEVTAKIPDEYELVDTYSDEGCSNAIDLTQTQINADRTIYVKVEKKATEEPPTETPSAKVVYLMNKTTDNLKITNEWSQVDLPFATKEITKGDWIIVSGKISMADSIGQLYVKWNAGSDAQLGSFYDEKNTANEKDIYWVYRVPEDGTINYAQLACQKATGSAVEAVPEGTEITFTDFFIARLPAADIDKLTTKIVNEESATMTYKASESNGTTTYGYEYSPTVNLTVPVGKLACLYERGDIKNGYESHYINGEYVESGAWEACYPSEKAQLISLVKNIPEEKACAWFQVGIQKQDTTEDDTLAITNLEIGVIPAKLFD